MSVYWRTLDSCERPTEKAIYSPQRRQPKTSQLARFACISMDRDFNVMKLTLIEAEFQDNYGILVLRFMV